MITLYHGSSEIITRPEIREPNRRLDFGVGFYLTSSYEQAKNWIKHKISANDIKCGFVNTYTFDNETANKAVKIQRFATATEDWLDFVMANRRIANFSHEYDIVIGPVANDRVYTAFSLYEGGIINKETLINELKTYRLVDQYLFHTHKSLEFLKFESAKTITK
jgi:hypothetical protein